MRSGDRRVSEKEFFRFWSDARCARDLHCTVPQLMTREDENTRILFSTEFLVPGLAICRCTLSGMGILSETRSLSD